MRALAAPEDVRDLVDGFYQRATADPLIGHFFAHLDLEAHLPRISAFWSTVLLGQGGYSGDPLTAHIQLDKRLRMEAQHFERWLALWEDTIDAHFAGTKAEEAKQRARTIAAVMRHKLEQARA